MTTPLPPIDFQSFIASFAAGAGATLEHVRELVSSKQDEAPAEGEPSKAEEIQNGLLTARHLIDTLVMLEGKTKGNLTDAEQKLLQGALADLRMSYVKTQGMVGTQGA